MKVQDYDEVEVDLKPTHFECIDEGQHFSAEEYGYNVDGPHGTDLEGVLCPTSDGHSVRWVHVSATPVASPDAVKREDDNWDGLSEVDADHFHYGDKQFQYPLEES